MAFAVQDFHDLIRLLGEHPDWQAELRRHVLTEELLALPAQMARLAERWDERFAALAEAQARTEARLAALVEAQARTDARLAALAARTEERFAELAEAQARTEERLERLEAAVDRLRVSVAQLVLADQSMLDRQERMLDRQRRMEGELLEFRYERHYAAYFARLARRLRLVEQWRLADLIDDGVDSGQFTDAERDLVLRADLLLTGRRRSDGEDVYLLVEVSQQVDPGDIARAAHRSGLLARLGRPVMPVVAGRSITDEAAAMAGAQGVWQVLDGRDTEPTGDV